MTLYKRCFSTPILGQKVTRDISGCVTGYFFKILSRVAVVVTGYILAKLSRVMSRVTLAPKMSRVTGCVTGYFFGNCHGLLQNCHEKKNTGC